MRCSSSACSMINCPACSPFLKKGINGHPTAPVLSSCCFGCLVVRFLLLADSEWRTCQLTAVTGSHLKPFYACLFLFFVLTWTCCSHLSSRGKLDSFLLPVPRVLSFLGVVRPLVIPFWPLIFPLKLVHRSMHVWLILCVRPLLRAQGACSLASVVLSWSEAYSPLLLLSCMSHNSRDKGRQVAECLGGASRLLFGASSAFS